MVMSHRISPDWRPMPREQVESRGRSSLCDISISIAVDWNDLSLRFFECGAHAAVQQRSEENCGELHVERCEDRFCGLGGAR